MNILIVGNIIKDIYLNLDPQTEAFETDKNHTKWLDLSFNGSEHHFFNRTSCLNGAAISLEVCQNFNLLAQITNSSLNFNKKQTHRSSIITTDYRYILTTDNQTSYLTSTSRPKTIFTPPVDTPDYIYVDRSANLSLSDATKIANFLQSHSSKLVLYLTSKNLSKMSALIPLAKLVFLEFPFTPSLLKSSNIVRISPNFLECKDIKEPINLDRADFFTHLSLYSIASATILCSFVLGKTVEESLKLARLNMENSRLNSTLTLQELQNLHPASSPRKQLELIAKSLIAKPKGIFIAKDSQSLQNSNISTPNLHDSVNGVILTEETAHQTAENGQNVIDYLTSKQIIPGIRITTLKDLATRLSCYYQMGMRFAKWRATFAVKIDSVNQDITIDDQPAIQEKCHLIADYARQCQVANLVPILEPKIIYNKTKPSTNDTQISLQILDCLLVELQKLQVNPRACIIIPPSAPSDQNIIYGKLASTCQKTLNKV